MNITFRELRQIKHQLPTGSVDRIANELNITPQTVRNYFGAKKYEDSGSIIGKHIQPGPDGGFVSLKDTTILDMALKLINENKSNSSVGLEEA
ncbi:MAG: putative transcriptional regulator [Saprospiraceae bacterium]|jgi:predicted transcriptional regulator